MIVRDFVEPELELYRKQCNFVGHEIDVFEMRSKGIPLEEIAEKLNLSVEGTKRISRKVNNKITKVLVFTKGDRI
jgi:transcriptional regulator